MSLVLMAVLISDLGPAKQIEMLKVPSEVYWASYRVSGAKLCSHSLREDQERRFDKRFGSRVSKLVSVIVAKGDKKSQDDELIVTPDCIAYRDRQAARKVLSRALDDFEPTLVEMELRYGIRNQYGLMPASPNATDFQSTENANEIGDCDHANDHNPSGDLTSKDERTLWVLPSEFLLDTDRFARIPPKVAKAMALFSQ